MWSESLALAAVRTYSWTAKEQSAEQGMALARMFAEIEGKVLPRCYALQRVGQGMDGKAVPVLYLV